MSVYQTLDTKPWYKYFWPWVLITIPTLTVIACMITIVLAIRSEDGLVSDDYYKEGLYINQTFARDKRAAELGVMANVQMENEGRELLLHVDGTQVQLPLKLSLLHATRKHQDQVFMINDLSYGQTRIQSLPLSAGKWYFRLESEPGNWRLTGQMRYPQENRVSMQPNVHGD